MNDLADEYPISMPPSNQDECILELNNALAYLKIKKDPALIVDGEHGYLPVKNISYIVRLRMLTEENLLLLESTEVLQIFSDILAYLVSKLNELDFKQCSSNSKWIKIASNSTQNERRISI